MATTQLNRVNQRFQPTPRHDGGIHTQSLTATTTRLVIVGESNLSVAGLAGMLEAQHKSTLVACLKPEEDCLEKLVAARPDALLIQHESLPQTLEAFMGEVQHQAPDTPILLFGKAMDDNHLYKLVRAGIRGYINDNADADHIRRALEQVLLGKYWVDRHILERFVTEQQRLDDQLEAEFRAGIEQLGEQLTRRELEILREVVKGLAIKQIAEHVHLSHQGVKMHLAKLFKKFNVANRNQLILATFDAISPLENLTVLLQNGLNNQLQRKHQHHRH